jgi:hypothetical protein
MRFDLNTTVLLWCFSPLVLIGLCIVGGFIYNCCIPSKQLFDDHAKSPFDKVLTWISQLPFGSLPYSINRWFNKMK